MNASVFAGAAAHGTILLALTYEDLLRAPARVMGDYVLPFLGLEPRALAASVVKRTNRSHADLIANWRGVRTALADKGFGSLLADVFLPAWFFIRCERETQRRRLA